MTKTKIAGIGMYVPENVVTNQDLTQVLDTSNEWIIERTGIQERHYVTRFKETSTTMGVEAAKRAIHDAGITPQDIDFIICNTKPRLLLSGMRCFVAAKFAYERNWCVGYS